MLFSRVKISPLRCPHNKSRLSQEKTVSLKRFGVSKCTVHRQRLKDKRSHHIKKNMTKQEPKHKICSDGNFILLLMIIATFPWPCLTRSALDPIGRSPFLPSWNLRKVELFSTFKSHLDDTLSRKCVSLFNFKEKSWHDSNPRPR